MRTTTFVTIASVLLAVSVVLGQQPRVTITTEDIPRETVGIRNVAASRGGVELVREVNSDLQARAYYSDTAIQLAMTPERYAAFTLSYLATYLGYPDIDFSQAPCELMKHEGVLSARYFAPKTSSVSASGRASELGWRQIARLEARKDSQAFAAGIGSAFVLLNYQQRAADVRIDPFARRPQYTQVMLVRREQNGDWPAYWLLFDADGVRITTILATFHGGDVSAAGQPISLPHACGQCHGRRKTHPHLNFFDVDQWHDRSSKHDDFALVRRSPAKVMATGSCGVTPMQVFEKLNREIALYNGLPATDAPDFVRAAVNSWVDKHPSPSRILKTVDRSFGVALWHPRDDAKLLTLLNRYCYRCHGTTKFDVFDKDAVLHRRSKMIEAIEKGAMPQDRQGDRQLSGDEKAALINALKKLR